MRAGTSYITCHMGTNGCALLTLYLGFRTHCRGMTNSSNCLLENEAVTADCPLYGITHWLRSTQRITFLF